MRKVSRTRGREDSIGLPAVFDSHHWDKLCIDTQARGCMRQKDIPVLVPVIVPAQFLVELVRAEALGRATSVADGLAPAQHESQGFTALMSSSQLFPRPVSPDAPTQQQQSPQLITPTHGAWFEELCDGVRGFFLNGPRDACLQVSISVEHRRPVTYLSNRHCDGRSQLENKVLFSSSSGSSSSLGWRRAELGLVVRLVEQW
jgi:hypothetical protein